MGLFSMSRTSVPELTPRLALATALLFMITADGHIQPEEIGQMVVSLNNDEQLFDDAIAYASATTFSDFLSQTASMLSHDQKICVLLNLCDSLMSDGDVAAEEESLFSVFLNAWEVSDSEIKPYMQMIAKKNDHSVLESQAEA